MVKDPFYRQIREALSPRLDGDQLDGDLFEACAGDLLRKFYPTLVSMPGGNDGGMDGVVADGTLLVCTTQKQVKANLTRSLESHRRTGGECRKVIVATSRVLTPPQRRKLRERARELEVTLVQIYEQRMMAALLYRNSRWCQDLLDLSGKPAALSVLPPSLSRPLVETELLGREADAEWLRSTSKDRILVGEPGAGKSYLLYRLALDGWGLFLASEEEEEIANAIRDQKPEVIIVDDAHADPARLERLAGLRQRIGATFSIVATTWRGHRDHVASALNVPTARIRTLELLPRRKIQQILEELGVEAPDEYLLELVDQASNKPGLAATLAALWLEGDWFSVLRGEALTRDSLRSVRRLVGRDEEGLLAVFSLGGRRGMPMKEVGKKLDLRPLETRKRVVSLTAAGVLSEAGGDCLAVQPRALRSVLLSSVFFGHKGTGLGYRDYLDLAPGYDCAVREIAAAAARGARIPFEELCRLLGRLDPAKYPLRKEASAAWGTFAGLGEREALWAFKHYPGELVDIARSGLHATPGATIQRLLEQAESSRSQESTQACPQLDILRRWICEPVGETLERRHTAIRAARRHAEAAESTEAFAIAFRLGCLTLAPSVYGDYVDPTRTGLTTRRGPLPQAQLEQMGGVWKDALELFRITGVVSFPELCDELWDWLEFSDSRGKVSEDEGRFVQQVVIEMLRDLTPLAAGRIGLSAALARLADRLDVELPLDPDPRFEILFPPISECLTSESSALEALAGEWADASPAEVVETLLHLTQEAKSITDGYFSNVSDVCRMLAVRAREPDLWFEVLTEKNVPSLWLAPFLDRLSTSPSFADRVRFCLRDEAYAEVGIRSALRLPEPSPDLLKAALKRAADDPSVIKGMGLRGELSMSVAKAVLAHPDPALALAMAFGEWMTDPKGEVRPELGELWRQAVLRSTEIESPNRVASYQLMELLGADPELSCEWLAQLGLKTSQMAPELGQAAKLVIGLLGSERRKTLLADLAANSRLTRYLPQLIGREAELYRRLLRRVDLKEFHLSPLQGLPEASWAGLAKLALRGDFRPQEVAGAAYSEGHVWRGTGEDYWRQWDEAFASLDCPADADPGWQEMIRHGRERAQIEIRRAEQRRRRIEHDGMIQAEGRP